jgi:hypothetical protein
MKIVILALAKALLVAVVAGAVFWSKPVGAAPLDPELQSVVERLAERFSDGVAIFIGGDAAYGQERTPFESHVVVLFGLTSWGGGNGSRQFLAVFERHVLSPEFPNGRRFQPYQLLAVVPVGDDADRWFKSIELEQDLIVLVGGRWLKDDAHCCPSAVARTVYRLESRGLLEQPR